MKKILILLFLLPVKTLATEDSGYKIPTEDGGYDSPTGSDAYTSYLKPPKLKRQYKQVSPEPSAAQSKYNTVAIIAGSFNPPHRGHLKLVTEALQKANNIIIAMYDGERNGIACQKAIEVWKKYLNKLGLVEESSQQQTEASGSYKIEITCDVEDYANNFYHYKLASSPYEYVIAFHGSDYDWRDLEERYRDGSCLSYQIAEAREAGLSASAFADKLRDHQSINECFEYLPDIFDEEEKEEIIESLID